MADKVRAMRPWAWLGGLGTALGLVCLWRRRHQDERHPRHLVRWCPSCGRLERPEYVSWQRARRYEG